MNAGKRDKYVTIQTNTPTDGTYGEKIPNWSNLSSVWASIATPSAKEINQNKDIQLDSVVIHMNVTTIDNSNRIKYGTEIYDIHAVIIFNSYIKIHAVRNHDRTS